MQERSRISLANDASLRLEPNPLFRLLEAPVWEHDPALLREQLGLRLNLLDLYGLFGEVDEGCTSGLFLSAPLLLSLDNGLLLLSHHRL
jgi:hypothetical protein